MAKIIEKKALEGTGKVFQFTVVQMFKNKSNWISLLIMFLFALVSVPLMTFFSGSNTFVPEECPISMVYYSNETIYEIDFERIPNMDAYVQNVSVLENPYTIEEKEQWNSLLGEEEVIIHIFENEEGFYQTTITFATGADQQVVNTFFTFSQLATSLLQEARYLAMGATPEQVEIAMGNYHTNTMTMEEYLAESEPVAGFETQFAIQYGYSILVLILCMMSATFIIRAIIEEKSSKLVELLMVSIQPLAMIVGKIFAVMIYVFAMILLMVVGMLLSHTLTNLFTEVGSMGDMMSNMGVDLSLLNLTPMTIVVVLISLVLGYFTFSIVAGIAGATCSNMEDVESANMIVVLLVLIGYMTATMTVAFESNTIAVITSLIPIVSIFSAPVQYVCGGISIFMLIFSWLLQVIVLFALAIFAAKIYRDLIMYKGSRMKMKQLLSLAFVKERKGEM